MLSPDFLFPCFLVFPPANPSNFSHCKCFSIQIPFLFQYRSIIFYVQVEHQEAVEEAVEFIKAYQSKGQRQEVTIKRT